MFFNVGDRVRCITEVWPSSNIVIGPHVGNEGTVRFFFLETGENPFYGVEWDEEIRGGHDLGGILRQGSNRGFYVYTEHIERITADESNIPELCAADDSELYAMLLHK